MSQVDTKKYRFAFFGTPELARIALQELCKHGLIPTVVITAPDKPAGRGMRLTPTPVKVYAEQKNIQVFTPQKITAEFIAGLAAQGPWDFFIVAAYGKILPKAILALPTYGTLNIHPSLLPKYRGPAPLEYVLLSDDTETGVTIMLIDELVDHGPILVQECFPLPETETIQALAEKSALRGAILIAEHIDPWIAGTLKPTAQNHEGATVTKKIEKSAGEISLNEPAWELWKKFRALSLRPGLYFYTEHNGVKTRVKIKTARWENGQFLIETVIPENGKPMPFSAL